LLVRRVLHVVNESGDGEVEPQGANAGDLCTFGQGGGLLVQHALPLVALDLPPVSGVRFANVDDEKCYLITEATVQGFELPSLGAKRRSGKAAENQRYRLVMTKRREPRALSTPQSREFKIRRLVAHRRGVGLALGDKLHHRRALLRSHAADERLHPLPIRRGEAFFQHLLESHHVLLGSSPLRLLALQIRNGMSFYHLSAEKPRGNYCAASILLTQRVLTALP